MLDATVVLQDVEALLETHFSAIQATWQTQATAEPTPETTLEQTANPIADFVTNLFMVFMFSELETRLAR